MSSLKTKAFHSLGYVYHDALARTFKRRARTKAFGIQARTLLRLLSPLDPEGVHFERIGQNFDGGYIMVADFIKTDGIAYSFGISDDVSWDMAMATRSYHVFQYDHTIDSLPTTHPNFHFSKIGISVQGSERGRLRSLETLIAENGHNDESNMILKIDIDGHEWDVFSEIPRATLGRFSQILVEFHSLKKITDALFFERALSALQNIRSNFHCVHVHANNFRDLSIIGGVPVPDALEVTFLRKDLAKFDPCNRTFPTELDQPNNPDCADIYLGSFIF